jgi:flavin reductase (DIM6/NTAB) family NADH-FMN oxidoreductase RutF
MNEKLDESDFRDALSRFASGVVVVAAHTPYGPVGFTASAFSSVSLEPPLVLVCVGKRASAFAGVVGAARFGISVLHESQRWIGEQFARPGDRFAGVPLVTDRPVPWIGGALAQFECEPHARHEAGDHVILVGEVVGVRSASGDPLVHCGRTFGGFDRDPAPPRAKGNAGADGVASAGAVES